MDSSVRKLYILPFDHRSSFAKLLGFDYANLTPEERAIMADRKQVIYEGALKGIELGVPKEFAAILVDEEFGTGIHSAAREAGITRILTVEASGTEEFAFAYGDQFGVHIDAIHPEYVKALVHYDRAGDEGIHGRLFENLRTLGAFCKEGGYKFLLEVLFPSDATGAYAAEAIAEFQAAGVEPDVWKIAGFTTPEETALPVTQARADGRDGVGVVILGRGESEEMVESWVAAGAKTEGVIGFAVGRTIFAEPIRAYHAGEIQREEAVERIGKGYLRFAEIFEAGA